MSVWIPGTPVFSGAAWRLAGMALLAAGVACLIAALWIQTVRLEEAMAMTARDRMALDQANASIAAIRADRRMQEGIMRDVLAKERRQRVESEKALLELLNAHPDRPLGPGLRGYFDWLRRAQDDDGIPVPGSRWESPGMHP